MGCTAYLFATPAASSYGQGMSHDVGNILAQMQGTNLGWACHLGISLCEEAPEMSDGDRLASAGCVGVADAGAIGLKIKDHDRAKERRRA